MAIGEFGVIDRFFGPLAGTGSFQLADDVAVFAHGPGEEIVLTTDTVASGIHFFADDPADEIARKAIRVNVSDLLAKGVDPSRYLMALALPTPFDTHWLAAFAQGLRADQDFYGIQLLGGDTIAHSAGPVITLTMLGSIPLGEVRTRDGGKPGDDLMVTGTIGGPAIGLAIRAGTPGPWSQLDAGIRDRLVRAYRLPEPPRGIAPLLRRHASASMDISDGLVGDADKLVSACGCSADIDIDSVPLAPGLSDLAAEDAILERLLTGGDDYQVLFALPAASREQFAAQARQAGIACSRIGELTPGVGPVRMIRGGAPSQWKRRAFDHADSQPGKDTDGR